MYIAHKTTRVTLSKNTNTENMNISLLSILHNRKWDFRPDMAQTYANALKNAIELQLDNNIEKLHGYFLSKKGYQKEGKTIGANFEDKLYVGNIHRIESHLYWNDEELAEDDEIINVVVVDGPITRDGGGCSYGSKDWRDQVLYANTIPQVVGHLFIVNTPGGEAECRNDYDIMFADCREKDKPTVALIDGGCYSSGVNLTCRCDLVIAMNPRDGYGCIGTMAAFWTVAHDTVDQDGYRYVELVGKDCPEKNAWWREAAKGEYEKLQAELDEDTMEFHQTVRENRPLVTDDMLSGKVFEAQEVIPALVDEIGDMERAIECIFALANKQMQPARFMTAPEPDGNGGEPEPGNEPEELAKLSEQQKEIATPKNDKEMTDEEKKAQEAAAAQAAEKKEEAAQAEAQGAEAPAAGGTDEGTQEGAGNGSGEGAGTENAGTEGTGEGTQEGAGEGTGEGAGTEGTGEGTGSEGTGEGTGSEDTGEGTGEDAGAGEGTNNGASEAPASEEALQNAQAEINKITETLHNAEQMVADRDKTIAEKDQTIADLQKSIDEKVKENTDALQQKADEIQNLNSQLSEKDATIEKLTKQIADLQAEVKEMAEKPGSMTNEKSGVPADNGTGDAPKVKTSRIKRGMSYQQIREAMKEEK